MNKLYLAGGCFWGVEEYFSRINGIVDTKVGYANSIIENPNYDLVCSGITKAAEAVEIVFDEDVIDLESILSEFFKIIDPTILNRQGNDVGTQYRTGIYYINEKDGLIINSFIKKIENNYKSKIVTEVKKIDNFYMAEEYHQKYLKKNPSGYCHINLK